MSQQQHYSQESEARQQQWSAQQARYTSSRRRGRQADMPKSEHPSTFEDAIPPYSYRAQDQRTYTQETNNASSERVRHTQQPREQPQAQMAGFWGQWQRQRQAFWFQQTNRGGIPRWMIIAAIVTVAVILSPPLIALIFSLIGLLLTGLFLIVVIPIIIILGLLIAGIVVVGLFLLGVIPRRKARRRRYW